MRKKALITTITVEHIVLTARINKRAIKKESPAECFAAANNIEYINGVSYPDIATGFIKENVPSIDILEYPTRDEYKNALKNNYDIVGIAFLTYTSGAAIKMARLAREAGVKEIWGGGHGVYTPGVEKFFDRVFSGFSENQLKFLLEGEKIANFRHPIFINKYDYPFAESFDIGYLFTIRGCKYSCLFCSGPKYYKELSITPIEEIINLLDTYREREIKHISIIDQTFLQYKEHAKKVIDSLHKRNLSWDCTSRVDLLQGRIKELKELGLTTVGIGIESLNDVSLQDIEKGETVNQTISLLRELESNRSLAVGTYMICLDNDDVETTKEAVEKLDGFKALFSVIFWIATPFPGTEYYNRSKQAGRIIDTNWEHYNLLHLVKKHPTISPDEARKLHVYCVKNHCHALNIRKKMILKKWEKLGTGKKTLNMQKKPGVD